MNLYYDYDGNPCSFEEWVRLFKERPRNPERWRIGLDDVGDVTVSTVWMGLDHALGTSELPLIYETLVSGGELDGETGRWSTRPQAELGHIETVRRVRLFEEAAT